MDDIKRIKELAAEMNDLIWNISVSHYEAEEAQKKFDAVVDKWVKMMDLLMQEHHVELYTISDPVLECKFLHHINIDNDTINLTGSGIKWLQRKK